MENFENSTSVTEDSEFNKYSELNFSSNLLPLSESKSPDRALIDKTIEMPYYKQPNENFSQSLYRDHLNRQKR